MAANKDKLRLAQHDVATALASWSIEVDPDETETFVTEDGAVVEAVDEEEAEVDHFLESTYGNLHFAKKVSAVGISNVLGLERMEDIIDTPYLAVKQRTEQLLRELSVQPSSYPDCLPQRGIYCSRTVNLRSIQAIGYDMDYTTVHYDVRAWEGKAYEYGLQALREMGCPVDGLHFDPDLVIRGLIMDTELGNLVKADRFGFIKRAMHGTKMLSPSEVRAAYGREFVNLKNEGRWQFLNTLFSVSEAVLYMQMVERLDEGSIPNNVCPTSYSALHKLVAKALFRAHVEGKLKAEIIQDPARYVELDPQTAQALLDQKQAGKQLLLITNSDYHYTDKMMSFAYDRFLPEGMGWRDLFDMVIVNARKPDFFNHSMSLYEIVTPDGLMKPAYTLRKGGLYCGGSAALVEKALGVSGDNILYVGDHIYTDAALAKLNFRWRTALVVRELEQEIEALTRGRAHRSRLKDLLNKKEQVGDLFNNLRLARQRSMYANSRVNAPSSVHLGPETDPEDDEDEINEALAQLLMVMQMLDEAIGPAVDADGKHFNKRWGYLSRCGVNDKSQLMRQIEKYADVYTSRVANFLRYSPFVYFRSPSQSLAHDRDPADPLVTASLIDRNTTFDSFDDSSDGGEDWMRCQPPAAARGRKFNY
ncbi:hypothetical protein N2152v2_004929 [Parachlorella kessleri]